MEGWRKEGREKGGKKVFFPTCLNRPEGFYAEL